MCIRDRIEINRFKVKIAGSVNGKHILVMDGSPTLNALKDGLTYHYITSTDYHTRASNNGYEAVKRILTENNIRILKVTPLVALGNVDGYILELDLDGYSILKQYAK